MGQLEKRSVAGGGERVLARFTAIAALLIFFALALGPALSKSPTADEGVHMLRGQVLRQTNELGLQGQHTPLGHWIIGTFFFTESALPDIEDLPSWPILSPESLVGEFLWQPAVNVYRAIFLARLPVIFMGLFMGAMLASWARQRNGFAGLIIVTVLFAFSPNLLASSALATTDLVAAAGILAAVFALWHFWQKQSLIWWLGAGLMIGLAIGAKLTGLLVMPITLILCYSHVKGQDWWRPGLIWASMLPIAGLVVWGIYGFEVGELWGLPVPAASYVSNFVEVQQHIERGHFAFLLGERSNEGWWGYFVIAYLVKTPAVTIILLIFSLVYLTLNHRWKDNIYLWLPAISIFLTASYSRLNIGYRHILAMSPFIWLLIAETASWWQRSKTQKLILALLLTLYAIGTLLVAPHHLAYFNEFIGGANNGPRYLGDSNIDWGQDLPLLADYYREFEGDALRYSYFGASDPAYYGIKEAPIVDFEGNINDFARANPSPGQYAISVNHLQSGITDQPDLFDWFRSKEPIGHLGYSILLFDVEESLDGAWVAHCLDPVAAIEQETANAFIGVDSIRHLYFDCRTSWVVAEGDEAGWYVLPSDLDVGQISPVIASNLTEIYSDDDGFDNSPYRIYHWSAKEKWLNNILSSAGPVTLTNESTIVEPLLINGIGELLGGLINEGVWGSIWRLEEPSEQPLSVLLHLYRDQEDVVVGDGLGYLPNQWQNGDVLIQYHDFETLQGRHLETGFYDFTTLERFPFGKGSGAADSVYILAP